ncbi:MAG: hypothetical protein AAGG79_05100 [Pseudomonadota bacterium]
MSLPAQQPETSARPRSRGRADERELAEQLRARIALAEEAALAAARVAEQRITPPEPPAREELASKRLGLTLLIWSFIALIVSIAILAWETVGPGAEVRALERPALQFSGLQTRYVQSAQGPTLEITGIVKNGGEEPVDPQVTLQLAGGRVAIEEPLRLGRTELPAGAERPFALRLLLPEGVRSVNLLPLQGEPVSEQKMLLVSPGWTAETPGL